MGKKKKKIYLKEWYIGENKFFLRKVSVEKYELMRWEGDWNFEIFFWISNKIVGEIIVLEIRIKYCSM